jgi:hypothetical protein
MVLRLGGWARGLRLLISYYELLRRISELAGCRKHDNKPSGSIKGGEFSDKLSDF